MVLQIYYWSCDKTKYDSTVQKIRRLNRARFSSLVTGLNNPDGVLDRVKDEPTSLNLAGELDPFDWRWYLDTAQLWCRSLERVALSEYLATLPLGGCYELDLRSRKDQPARTAKLEV